MRQSFSAFLIAIFGLALGVQAQDLPALPPLPGETSAATSSSATALPPLPGETAAPAPAASGMPLPALPDQTSAVSGSSTLPALPDQASTVSAQPALPTLPGSDASAGLSEKELKKQKKEAEKAAKKRAEELQKLNKQRKKQGLEPLAELPTQGGAPAPTAGVAVAMPPLPGAETVSPQIDAQPQGVAAAETPAVATEGVPSKKTAKKPIQKWHAPDFGPNVIFGGMVRTKGGTTEEKLAWVSQHVLNAMDFNGYQVQKEEGVYAGQSEDGKEWRRFTFLPRKKKSTAPIVIFVEPAKGNNVFLRVGPPESPAGVPAAQVKKMRAENQQVMRIMSKQLKGALRPAGYRGEVPYRHNNG